MRNSWLGLLLLLAGCDSPATVDSGTDVPAADTPTMTDTPATTDTPADVPSSSDVPMDDAPSTVDAPEDAPVAAGEAPVITMVAWTTPSTCSAGVDSDYTVTVTATDADTPVAMLTYDGSVGGCSGAIDDDEVVITCPNAAPYGGDVTVSDPEGNEDSVSFTIAPCTDGSFEP